MTMLRIIKWLAALGGLCVILLFALVLLLPRILDGQTVRETIRTLLLTRTNGEVTIEKLDLKWFPRPAVVVSGAALAFTDKVSVKIPSTKVYPSVRGLFTGHLEIARVEATGPKLSVHLAEPGEEPFNIDALEAQIRSLLTSLAAQIPGMVVVISGGSADLKIGERAPVAITNLGGRLVPAPCDMQLQISSRANVFDSLRVEGRIDGETLTTKGQIKVENLRQRESMAAFLSHPPDYIGSGIINLNVGLTSTGLKK